MTNALLALLLVVSFVLSGCCLGQWCLGGGGNSSPETPPAVTNVDDRTTGVDPRITP